MATQLSRGNNKDKRKRCIDLNDDKPLFKMVARRNSTVKKKAIELATLCDVTVCMISFGPYGDVELWPEINPVEVNNILIRYKLSKGKKNLNSNLSSAPEEEETVEGEIKNNGRDQNFSHKGLNSDEGLEKVEAEDLMVLSKILDSKLDDINEKIKKITNLRKNEKPGW